MKGSVILALLFISLPVLAEDGYDLWLRYRPVTDEPLFSVYQQYAAEVVVQGDTLISGSVRDELQQGLSGLLNSPVPVSAQITRAGAVVAGCSDTSPLIAGLGWNAELEALGDEGFIIRSETMQGMPVTVIAGSSDRGTLYGAFRYLNLLQRHKDIRALNMTDRPVNNLRLLNHWDQWNGAVTRGYAGGSIFKWNELPDTVDPRYRDYARTNASIGINGSVINCVNADLEYIQSENLPKVAALANVFRGYGITLYLSIRYDSPIALGGLHTADPLDPDVIQWWEEKAAEIYEYIPDFGGFLVKGDSEGQPGPLQYGRNHAVGANMLADVLRPYGGIVMWRTFVYGISGLSPDRVKQGYEVFKPLDGRFADNVVLQAKNGPLDFQVREPVNPLFGGMPNTNTGIELQITQEYAGTNVALCWFVPQWKDVFEFDTSVDGSGSTVKKVIDGSLFDRDLSLAAGVSNLGSDQNWTRHPLHQANWYGFGRLAWNPDIDAEEVADDWVRMTFSNEENVIADITNLLIRSWETFERYTSPIGVGIMVGSDRMSPNPAGRQNYHQADQTGVGYNRTRMGSGYVNQYQPPMADVFNELDLCPEELLLWFHHVPYTHRLTSGKTLIQTFYDSYRQGVNDVSAMITKWETLEGRIDTPRYGQILERLRTQLTWAIIWRDACIDYFSQMSGIPDSSVTKTHDPQPVHGTKVLLNHKFQVGWKTGCDPEDLTELNDSVGAYYLYWSDDPFLNVNPIDIAADVPVQDSVTYSPLGLRYNKTYYWRVDQGIYVNGNLSGPCDPHTIVGDVWSFESISVPSVASANLDFGAGSVQENFCALTSADNGATLYNPFAVTGDDGQLLYKGIKVTVGGDSPEWRVRTDQELSGVPNEEIWRDFVFASGLERRLNITIEGLFANSDYNLTLYSFDALSVPSGVRQAEWLVDEQVVLTTEFGIPNLTRTEQMPATESNYIFKGMVRSDANGRIVLSSRRGAGDQAGGFYAYVNALVIDLVNIPTGICITNLRFDVSGPDGNPDCVVNIYDFAVFAGEWLTTGLFPVE